MMYRLGRYPFFAIDCKSKTERLNQQKKTCLYDCKQDREKSNLYWLIADDLESGLLRFCSEKKRPRYVGNINFDNIPGRS